MTLVTIACVNICGLKVLLDTAPLRIKHLRVFPPSAMTFIYFNEDLKLCMDLGPGEKVQKDTPVFFYTQSSRLLFLHNLCCLVSVPLMS